VDELEETAVDFVAERGACDRGSHHLAAALYFVYSIQQPPRSP
jgi:hypothetical protein